MQKAIAKRIRVLSLGGAYLLGLAAITLADTPTASSSASSLAEQSFQIESATKNAMIMPEAEDSADGTSMVVTEEAAWKCMTWKFKAAGSGIRLINYSTGKTMVPNSEPDEHGITAVLQQTPAKQPVDTEQWRFVPLDNDTYRIEYIKTGDVLTAGKDGNLIVGRWMEADSQKWKLSPKPDKFTG